MCRKMFENFLETCLNLSNLILIIGVSHLVEITLPNKTNKNTHIYTHTHHKSVNINIF